MKRKKVFAMKKRVRFLYIFEGVLIFLTITMILLLAGCTKENRNTDGPTSVLSGEKIQMESENQSKETQMPEETVVRAENSEEKVLEEEATEVLKQEEESNEETLKEEAQTEEAQTEETTDADEKTYYGHWEITDFLAPWITALSTEEMENYVNMRLTYTEDSFLSGDLSLDSPIYNETVITKEEFADGYNNQVTFESLNVSASSVTEVSIANASEIGSMFLVADENTLYIMLDGAFFKAVRQSE